MTHMKCADPATVWCSALMGMAVSAPGRGDNLTESAGSNRDVVSPGSRSKSSEAKISIEVE